MRHFALLGQDVSPRQLRGAAFFTLCRVMRRRPIAADRIHVPQNQGVLLDDALDEVTRYSLKKLVAMSAKMRVKGRTANQKEDRYWKDRLRKARQEVWCGSEPPRYVLCEDIRSEIETNARSRGRGLSTAHVNERWKKYCFGLELFDVDGRMITKAEAISQWLHEGWSWHQCVRHFKNYVDSAFYDIGGEVITRAEALARWQSEGYSHASCCSYLRKNSQLKVKRGYRSPSPGFDAFVARVTEEYTGAGSC